MAVRAVPHMEYFMELLVLVASMGKPPTYVLPQLHLELEVMLEEVNYGAAIAVLMLLEHKVAEELVEQHLDGVLTVGSLPVAGVLEELELREALEVPA
jgi:hypothetical protein